MADSLGGVLLPEGFLWTDRLQYSPIVQVINRTLSGNLVISAATVSAGRPITLVGEGNDMMWMSLAIVQSIMSLAANNAVQTLIFNGERFQVKFRHHEPPAVEFSPIYLSPTCPYYEGIIKLMTV